MKNNNSGIFYVIFSENHWNLSTSSFHSHSSSVTRFQFAFTGISVTWVSYWNLSESEDNNLSLGLYVFPKSFTNGDGRYETCYRLYHKYLLVDIIFIYNLLRILIPTIIYTFLMKTFICISNNANTICAPAINTMRSTRLIPKFFQQKLLKS